MCPHCAHRLRWNHHPPTSRHSAQPVPDGVTAVSIPSMLTPPTLPCRSGGIVPDVLVGVRGSDPTRTSGTIDLKRSGATTAVPQPALLLVLRQRPPLVDSDGRGPRGRRHDRPTTRTRGLS